jgi:hypothetical protein
MLKVFVRNYFEEIARGRVIITLSPLNSKNILTKNISTSRQLYHVFLQIGLKLLSIIYALIRHNVFHQ